MSYVAILGFTWVHGLGEPECQAPGLRQVKGRRSGAFLAVEEQRDPISKVSSQHGMYLLIGGGLEVPFDGLDLFIYFSTAA